MKKTLRLRGITELTEGHRSGSGGLHGRVNPDLPLPAPHPLLEILEKSFWFQPHALFLPTT